MPKRCASTSDGGPILALDESYGGVGAGAPQRACTDFRPLAQPARQRDIGGCASRLSSFVESVASKYYSIMPKSNNSFKSPEHIEETIVDKNGAVIGTIRIKPSGILWKAKSQQKFKKVDLATFLAWINDPKTNAELVTK
jgi:hypothetical protein